jgi:hypothetical protein
MRKRIAATTTVMAVVVISAASWLQAPAYADSSDRRRAEQRAEELRQQSRSTAGDLAGARAQLVALATQANAALDSYQRAAFAARAAQVQQHEAEARLAAAAATADEQRRRISVFVTQTYRTGGLDNLNLMVEMLTEDSPEDLLHRAGNLQTVGQRQADAFTQMRVARLAEEQARAIADQAAATAVKSAQDAGEAKKHADALVAQQQQQVTALQGQLSAVQGAVRTATARAAALRRAEQIARQRASSGRGMGPVGSCKGGDVSGYPNGRLPTSALCPLWGTPGEALRADAAAGFNRMSRAFAAEFGSPICVTDSYRSYSEQQRVYREKPGLAAKPGTSNHGWGLATDLCGGVQNDGTAANNWLRQNAGRFNWFHPSWGDPGGSGPYEPWHWEYAGG